MKSWMHVAIKAALITGGFALYIFVESGTRDRISRLENEFDQVETRLSDKIDRVEAKLSDRIDRVEAKLSDRIDRVETGLSARIDRLEAKVDRVETKVDEVRGYLKINTDVAKNDTPPADEKE